MVTIQDVKKKYQKAKLRWEFDWYPAAKKLGEGPLGDSFFLDKECSNGNCPWHGELVAGTENVLRLAR